MGPIATIKQAYVAERKRTRKRMRVKDKAGTALIRSLPLVLSFSLMLDHFASWIMSLLIPDKGRLHRPVM